jgi:AraC family transcriptional regulator
VVELTPQGGTVVSLVSLGVGAFLPQYGTMIRIDSVHIDVFTGGSRLEPHRHANAYAALVIDGGYQEISLDGRYDCRAGSLIIHPPFHQHADEFGPSSGSVLNLPLPDLEADLSGFRMLTVSNLDALLRLAHDDPEQAGQAVLEEAQLADPTEPPIWMTSFMALIAGDYPVGDAASKCGVSPEHASRAVRRWFGIGPSQLRREARVRCAISALQDGASPAEAACEAGFADQPHLTRTLKAATGLTPTRFGRC